MPLEGTVPLETVDQVVKFTEPLVVNGKVYVANKTAVVVYGLLH